MILEFETRFKTGQRIYYIDYNNGPEVKSMMIEAICAYVNADGSHSVYYVENNYFLNENDAFFSDLDAKEFFRENIRGGVL